MSTDIIHAPRLQNLLQLFKSFYPSIEVDDLLLRMAQEKESVREALAKMLEQLIRAAPVASPVLQRYRGSIRGGFYGEYSLVIEPLTSPIARAVFTFELNERALVPDTVMILIDLAEALKTYYPDVYDKVNTAIPKLVQELRQLEIPVDYPRVSSLEEYLERVYGRGRIYLQLLRTRQNEVSERLLEAYRDLVYSKLRDFIADVYQLGKALILCQ